MLVLLTKCNTYAKYVESKQQQKFFNELGDRIAKYRKQRGFSQERLAADSDIDRVAVGYIEQGRRKPTVTTVYKIAKALGIKLEDLFKGL